MESGAENRFRDKYQPDFNETCHVLVMSSQKLIAANQLRKVRYLRRTKACNDVDKAS